VNRKNYFVNIGVLFLFLAGMYALAIRQEYGTGIPRNTSEWMAEIHILFLVVTAATFIAVGKYLGDVEK
jgi:uncharacterized membrane protein